MKLHLPIKFAMLRYLLISPVNQALLLLLFLINSATAQKIEVSEPIDLGRESKYRLVGQFDSTILFLREGFNQWQIQALGQSLQVLWKKELSFPKNQIEILSVLNDNSHFNIIYGFHQKGKTELRIKKLGVDAVELADTTIYTFSNDISFRDLEISLSENKQKILIYAVMQDNKMDWVCFDIAKEQFIWAAENAFQKIDLHKNFAQVLINNSGEVFLIAEYNNTKRKKHQHYFEGHLVKADEKTSSFKIPFAQFLSLDYLFVYDERNKQLIVSGLYAENPSIAKGLFYTKYNFSDSAQLHTIPFDETFMRSLTGEKRKKLDGIENLDINDIILRRDGGIILVAEQNIKYEYQLVGSSYTDVPTHRQIDYLFENVLVASIHPDGTLHWREILYKSQSSENDQGRYSSFFLMKTPSNLRFIYNDDVKWSSNIFEYELSPKGEAKRKRLFEKEEEKNKEEIMPEFKKAIQISSNTMIAGHFRNNKLKIIRIVYE
jgi:hypothetical protein